MWRTRSNSIDMMWLYTYKKHSSKIKTTNINFNILLYYVFCFLVLVLFFSCTSWKNMWINYEVNAIPSSHIFLFAQLIHMESYWLSVTDKTFCAYIFIISISRLSSLGRRCSDNAFTWLRSIATYKIWTRCSRRGDTGRWHWRSVLTPG